MNKIQKRRLYYIICCGLALCAAAGLILFALKQNINVFVTPTQLVSGRYPADYHFRLGGLVKRGSVIRSKDNLNVTFIVTDLKHELLVHYDGILPDLFREGTGVVVEGVLDSNHSFIAARVLAKHDENYMPKEVYRALRENNQSVLQK